MKALLQRVLPVQERIAAQRQAAWARACRLCSGAGPQDAAATVKRMRASRLKRRVFANGRKAS